MFDTLSNSTRRNDPNDFPPTNMQHDYYSGDGRLTTARPVPSTVLPSAPPLPSSPPPPPRTSNGLDGAVEGPPPPVTSNTYHQNGSNPRWTLPTGWKTAHRESDGRIYYWELATGRSTWSHPSATLTTEPAPRMPLIDLPFFTYPSPNAPNAGSTNSPGRAAPNGGTALGERPTTAHRHPDSHQCFAFLALILFPPLGTCALVHSLLVGRRWREGRYGEAHEHARQAYNYAWWSVAVLVGIVVWRYVVREGWPDVGGWFD